jgi:hypothetical protein
MQNYPDSFDHMLAAWNESDPAAVRQHLEAALSPAIRFVDPSIDLTGIDAFEANVHAVQARIPGAVYSRTSEVDSQHNFHRYYWAIHQNGELVLPGFDVAETDTNGRVVCVIGFFGPLAKL